MKLLLLFSRYFLLILIGFVVDVSAQSMYDTYSGFTTPTSPVLPSNEIHPSLYFNSSQLNAMKARMNNSAYSAIKSRITSSIVKYKAMKISAADENDRPKLAKYCAFDWIINGVAASRDSAIQALVNSYPWYDTGDSLNFDKPYDEIYRATWIQNYCSAYDWLQNQLTANQDSVIRFKIGREARVLRQNMASFAPRPHNHRSKPAWGLGTAALTLSGDSRAADWLQYALTMCNTVTKYQFSSDGIYREGSHYYIYSLVNAIPFLWHYKNVSGVDLFPYYQPAFEWPVLIRDQRGWMPNNEDGNLKPAPTHMVAKAYTSAVTRLHSTAPLSSILQWNWTTTNFFTTDYTGATNDICWDIDEFLLYDSTIPSVAPDINPTLKLSTGQVVFRNTWAAVDSTMRYLLYFGVAAADNHDHPDELSYIINARNTCLAVDAGYGESFWNYATWYTQPPSHNLVMTNDTAPIDFAVNQTPTDRHFLMSPIFDFSEKEAKTSAANGKIRRGIAFINDEYWVIYDLPSSTTSTTVYKLNLHGRGTLLQSGNNATWNVASDPDYGAAAKLHSYFKTTETPTITQKAGTTCLFKDSVAQTYIEVAQIKDTVGFLHLMSTTAASGSAPLVTDISSGAVKGFERSIDASTIDAFILQKKSAVNTVGYITTDAFFAWARRNGTKLLSCMMNDGTMFRWNGTDLLSSSQPLALVFNCQTDSLPWIVIDTLPSSVTLNVKIAGIKAVKLNSSPITYSIQGDGSVSFTISVAGRIDISRQTTSVGRSLNELPVKFQLNQNYPNPFNPTTVISYDLAVASMVGLKVYDLFGRVVAVLVNENKSAGAHSVQWNAAHCASGMYFARLESAGKMQVQKLVLMK